MPTDPLEDAIMFIKQGKLAEAQNLLRDLLSTDPHNLPAWSWYVETYSQDEQRIKALTLCLKYNPENNEAKQALEKLKLNSRESKAISFRYLFGISALFALPVAILGPLFEPVMEYAANTISSDVLRFESLIILTLGMLGLQYAFVLPATLLAFVAHTELTKKNKLYKIHPVVRAGIPLIVNLIAASSSFIIGYVASYLFGTK
jgi:hypothetical protein